MAKVVITADTILTALESARPKSFTELYKAMGARSKPSGATIKKLKSLVKDLDKRLQANMGESKPSRRSGTLKPRKSRKWPRHRSNPFRQSCSYALCYDILAAHPKGMTKEKWLELYAKASGKDPKTTARYDLAVLLTAKDSPTSERHRSCRENFWIEREADFVILRTKKS